MPSLIHHSYLIPLLPLIGALIAALLGAKYLKDQSHWPIWLGVGASAVMAIVLLVGMLGNPPPQVSYDGTKPLTAEDQAHMLVQTMQHHSVHWFDWIVAGDASTGVFTASAGAFIDPLTCVMLSVICGIGFLITVFAAGYMKGEAGYFRFFCYLGLFIFAMTCLVMGDNLAMLYLGWEGVGVCSYLLIGYYYDRPAAREAAKKAFIVNRIGDFGFALGIFLVFYCFGTISFFGDGVGTNTGFLEKALSGLAAPGREQWVSWIPFALMIGAFGKSAQFPLYVWLPDAMEGPTPVSALIHAATMVTAGVYMIVRLSTLFVGNTAAMITIAVVGAFTALLAASIALRQTDLKKVFAYSTVSQLGYMFVGVAVLSPVAAVFHLITHAFFKALLFLSSGVVMHATGGELNMCKMSGLKKSLPVTRVLMLVGCLALAGFPLLAGFWSKDEIVSAAGAHSLLLNAVLLFTAFLTAYYTFRLYFRVFEGPELVPHTSAGIAHGGLALSATGHVDNATGGMAGVHPLADQTGAGTKDGIKGDGSSDLHGATPGELSHGSVVGPTHTPSGRVDDHHHNHEPLTMILPLIVLAIGALLAGVINLPFDLGIRAHSLGHFLSRSPSLIMGREMANQTYGGLKPADEIGFGGHAEGPFEVLPLIIGGAASLLGIGLAYALHLQNRSRADSIAASVPWLTRAMDHKYWIDELYQHAIVEPLRLIGSAFWAIDRFIIDGVVFMVSFSPQLSGYVIKTTTQRGYLQGYALSMLLGIAVIIIAMFM